jgi:hypothetical protein
MIRQASSDVPASAQPMVSIRASRAPSSASCGMFELSVLMTNSASFCVNMFLTSSNIGATVI